MLALAYWSFLGLFTQFLDACYYERLSYSISISCVSSSDSTTKLSGSLKVDDAADNQTTVITEEIRLNTSWCITSLSSLEVVLNISNSIGDIIFSSQSKRSLIIYKEMYHIVYQAYPLYTFIELY